MAGFNHADMTAIWVGLYLLSIIALTLYPPTVCSVHCEVERIDTPPSPATQTLDGKNLELVLT